jgi:hypothetical protein
MAGGGFVFLLLPFQYLVGWGIINLVISINLFLFSTLCEPEAQAQKFGVPRSGSPFAKSRSRFDVVYRNGINRHPLGGC